MTTPPRSWRRSARWPCMEWRGGRGPPACSGAAGGPPPPPRPARPGIPAPPPPESPVAQARLARKLASTMGMDDWVRVRLGRVGGRLVATPLPRGAGVLTSLVRADGLLVVPAELEGHHAGEEVSVRLLRGVGEIERTIVATGSHDLVLDLAASTLRERDPRLTLASSNVGSLGGLTALRDAGTRVLLDHELARRGISPEAIVGYEREEHTHLAVAAGVAAGRADCGLGLLAAARAFRLDFVPVAQEPYDLVVRADSIEDELLAPLWALLESPEFREEVTALGGYDTAEMGRRIR